MKNANDSGTDDVNVPIVTEGGRATLRRMIQHEDDLRNQRLAYLLTLNGLLFTALAFAWRAPHALSLVVVLAVMGVLIAASAFFSMRLSDRAIRYLRNRDPMFRNLDGGTSGTGDDVRSSPAVEGAGSTATESEELRTIPVAISGSLLRSSEAQRAGQAHHGREGILHRAVDRGIQPWRAFPVILGGAWVAIFVIADRHLHW